MQPDPLESRRPLLYVLPPSTRDRPVCSCLRCEWQRLKGFCVGAAGGVGAWFLLWRLGQVWGVW